MTSFEQDKANKLERLHFLRFLNMLGAIAWREDKYGGAEQLLRLLHPVTVIYLLITVLVAAIMYGVIEVSRELKRTFKEDCVLW